jgi:hypothetical protein
MSHGHASQEGEHAAHHASDPFDRKVAMSMVVIAALLAAVKVLGHRTHNETLAYQIKAGVAHTQESDQWNFFQAKKMREVISELRATMLSPELSRRQSESEWLAQFVKDLEETEADLEKGPEPQKLPPILERGEKALAAAKKARDALAAKPNVPPERVEQYFEAKLQAQRYRADSRIILNQAAKKHHDAQEFREKSTHKHHQADFFDLGELAVELALVLSSVAILTKRPGYWYAGIALSALGIVLVAIGFFVH